MQHNVSFNFYLLGRRLGKNSNTRRIADRLRQGVPCSAEPGDGGVISVVGWVNILLDRAGISDGVRDIPSGKERPKISGQFHTIL